MDACARHRSDRGFTITEILVALSILALAVVALMRAFDIGLGWTARGNDQTVAVNLAQQRIEQIKAWVEGSTDPLERIQRFAALGTVPWQEPRTRLTGELSRFARETVVSDDGVADEEPRTGLGARLITVRIYLSDAPAPVAELTAMVTAQP
jgi:prepilin-type N-terminal cleavage/methylation domain-containing protein